MTFRHTTGCLLEQQFTVVCRRSTFFRKILPSLVVRLVGDSDLLGNPTDWVTDEPLAPKTRRKGPI